MRADQYQDDSNNETAQLTFVILGMIYAIISIYATIRLMTAWGKRRGKLFCGFSADSRLAWYFYFSILCESLTSTGCFLILGLFDFYSNNSADKSDRVFWCIVLIPDIMYLISYGIMFWQLFKLYLEGHIHVSSEVYIPYIRRKGLGYSILLWGLVIYLLSQAIISVLYVFQVISFVWFNIELSLIITSVCTFILIFLFTITIKFSGQPYQNDEYRQKIRTLLLVVVIWSFLKIIRACFGFTEKDNNFISRVLEGLSFQSGDKWESIEFIIIFLVCEITPFLMVLDTSLIKIFKLEARRSNSMLTLEEETSETIEVNENFNRNLLEGTAGFSALTNAILEEDKEQGRDKNSINVKDSMSQKLDRHESHEIVYPSDKEYGAKTPRTTKKSTKSRYIRIIKEILITDNKDFILSDEFSPPLKHKQKKNVEKSFGKLYHAVFRGEKLLCRLIKFDRLTTYLTEDLYEEIQITNSLFPDHIVKIKGMYIEESKIHLFYPELVSLYNFLHIQEVELTNLQKLEIAMKICDSIRTMHENKPNMVHAHLSSRNLFIERVVENNEIRHKIQIGDLGDLSIRQSAKIFLDYDVRNTWSSPEIMEDPNLVFTSRKISMDIYSFGLILWELFSRVVPFGDNTEGAKSVIVDKNFRPKIRYESEENSESTESEQKCEKVPEEIAEVIKHCWAKSPNERPQTLSDIYERFKLINWK